MVWSPDQDFSYAEAAKIAPIVVQYMQGRALDVGPGSGKVWPQAIGIDQQMDHGRPCTDIVGKADDLSLFADESMDAVFSSHCLEDFPRDKVPAVLAEWTRVLKIGGNLILYVPSANLYPKVGEEGANPMHKWDIYPGDIEGLLKDQADVGGCGWDLLVSEERGEGNEYSILVVAQKTVAGWAEDAVWERHPDGKQRALVIRYGAIGDAIVCASILPELKKQGFHVTVNTTPKIQDVLRRDPNIDEWLIQATDYVPNDYLGPFWKAVSERYDRVINLSESVEVSLLAVPGRLNHGYPQEARRRIMGTVNYLERTHDIAGVPYDFSGSRFHPSYQEMLQSQAAAMRMRGADGAPIVVWCVNGSSVHKVYPWTAVVVRWLLERTPAHIVLYGDPGVGAKLGNAVIDKIGNDYPGKPGRVESVAASWPIRQSLAFARLADVIVGPETGPMNAMAMEEIPKVIYLSHSSAENLTKHWVNTTVLEPDVGRSPCYPCHQMHYDWSSCVRDDTTHAAACASAVAPELVFKAIAVSLGATVKEAAD